MIPESTLRQIAEHSISAESRALAKQLLEAISLPGYERLAKERDAAREELAKQRRHINRPQYEAMQKERDDANAALRRMTNTHAAVVAERDAARAENERLAKELSELVARIEEAHNGYHDDGRELGVARPASHLTALNELLAEQCDIAALMARHEAEQPKPAGGGA